MGELKHYSRAALSLTDLTSLKQAVAIVTEIAVVTENTGY